MRKMPDEIAGKPSGKVRKPLAATLAQSVQSRATLAKSAQSGASSARMTVPQSTRVIAATQTPPVQSPLLDGRVVLEPGERGYLRIGAVARLTGIPQATLRAWESRYAAFSPVKSEGGQRLFLPQDATRATLIRILSRQGHSLPAIASAPLDKLLALKAQHEHEPMGSGSPKPSRRTIIVCGEALAVRLIEASQQADSGGQSKLHLASVIAGFAEVEVLRLGGQCDLVAIELVSLHRAQSAAVLRLVAALPRLRFLVLYRFGPQNTVRELQNMGVDVRREPVDDATLALAIRELLPDTAWGSSDRHREAHTQAWNFSTPPSTLPPPEPRFTPTTLRAIQGIPAKLPCECPRHVAELLAQLMAFERYSKECLTLPAEQVDLQPPAQNPPDHAGEDSLLHYQLWQVAASCRLRIEEALEWVATHEGIDLQAIDRDQRSALAHFQLPQTSRAEPG